MSKKTSSLNDSRMAKFPDDDLDWLEGQNHKVGSRHLQNDLRVQQVILLLQDAGWLQKCSSYKHPAEPSLGNTNKSVTNKLPDLTKERLAGWKKHVELQEAAVATARRNALNPDQQVEIVVDSIAETEMGNSCTNGSVSCACSATESIGEHAPGMPQMDSDARSIVTKIGTERGLNEKQWLAFRIISDRFITKFVEKKSGSVDQLIMLMTGPGGTGKTYIMNAVQAVMTHYGCGHMIRFLAPTGSAAALINGMTVHKGLGIKIKSKNKGKGNRNPGESFEDYTVMVSVKERTRLREEWKNVEFLLVDETSLIGLELLAEIDHALRFAKEKLDVLFGGVTVIFAGDFFQYLPVGGTLLYSPITPYAGQSDAEIQKRLGRMSWKLVNTVINLTEQQRMRLDSEYGEAVQCLRTRECTLADVDLFNSRVVKSATNPGGVDMYEAGSCDASAIVATNKVQEALNQAKAYAQVGNPREVISCFALDKCSHKALSLVE